MSAEVPKQFDMFSGNAVDNRTRTQKKQDRQRVQPKQSLMFSQPDMAQFGVNTKPKLPLSPNTKLTLMREDPRTEEQIERDLQLAAEALTFRMFVQAIGVTPQGLRIRLPEISVTNPAIPKVAPHIPVRHLHLNKGLGVAKSAQKMPSHKFKLRETASSSSSVIPK